MHNQRSGSRGRHGMDCKRCKKTAEVIPWSMDSLTSDTVQKKQDDRKPNRKPVTETGFRWNRPPNGLQWNRFRWNRFSLKPVWNRFWNRFWMNWNRFDIPLKTGFGCAETGFKMLTPSWLQFDILKHKNVRIPSQRASQKLSRRSFGSTLNFVVSIL